MRIMLIMLSLLSMNAAVAAQPHKVLSVVSIQDILERHKGEPFIMALWSLECAACYKELEMLSELQQQYSLKLVLISVDGVAAAAEIGAVLEKDTYPRSEFWVFADYDSVQLRYALDPAWQGELPRTYLYDAQQHYRAISGLMDKKMLESWMVNHQQRK